MSDEHSDFAPGPGAAGPATDDAEHDCELCSPPLIPVPAPWDRPGAEDPATWGTLPL
jgi:hypothetical protein